MEKRSARRRGWDPQWEECIHLWNILSVHVAGLRGVCKRCTRSDGGGGEAQELADSGRTRRPQGTQKGHDGLYERHGCGGVERYRAVVVGNFSAARCRSMAPSHAVRRFGGFCSQREKFSQTGSDDPDSAAVTHHSVDHLSRPAHSIMAATADAAKQQSILPTLIPHLDRHLVFPLLQFLEDQEDVDEPSLEHNKLKFELLKHTNMTDFVGDLFAKINNLDERPEEYVQKRDEVLKKREQLQDECSKIQDLLADTEVVNNLRSDKVQNLNYLKENHGVTIEMVDALYEFGQFQYSCGDYNSASELLYQFRILVRSDFCKRLNLPTN